MNRIKELRESRNVSQEELATVLDTTQQSISLYESVKREPKLEAWQQLADYFDVSVPYLQGFNEHKPNRLKELRNKKGMSQSQFVQAFNELLISKKMKPITIPTYSRWENSLNSPTEKVWQQLADFFEVSVSYIKGEIDTEQLEKLIELTIFFCFPKATLNNGKEELDEEFKPFIIIGILSRMLSLLGYDSKNKFQKVYQKAIHMVDDQITFGFLNNFKCVVDETIPDAEGITNNLLQAYEKL
ncbi:helix-turn-helix transcriptional regulator [Lactobacillus sp. M0390]|uniref:helix-turn-helix transcriptional regulator n=1 Tax=Lactobacillus sp. M0390 TaxID=2751026 RepID=UPI0018DE33E2|nr:helix-turn-helix transcriptional regulator [Lactobacillus sp. M0390]MBH9985176.1 transcriptional regulator [Lactobacillus sp. M0390]